MSVERANTPRTSNCRFWCNAASGKAKCCCLLSGTYSPWNTLAGKNSNISLFDRILRSLIEDTMPPRNFETGEPIVLPVEPDRSLQYTLTRPNGEEDPVTLSALGADVYGLAISQAYQSGRYQITANNPDADRNALPGAKQTVLRFAVMAEEESDFPFESGRR